MQFTIQRQPTRPRVTIQEDSRSPGSHIIRCDGKYLGPIHKKLSGQYYAEYGARQIGAMRETAELAAKGLYTHRKCIPL